VTRELSHRLRSEKPRRGLGRRGFESRHLHKILCAAFPRRVSVVPLLLGGGIRLFDHLGADPIALEQTRVIESEGVTHLRYRVVT